MGERRPAIIIAACIAVFLAIVVVWALIPSDGEEDPPAGNLQEVTDAAGIQNHIELSHISIATSTNYFGHKIYLIHGVLKNVSEKPIRSVDAKMAFTDADGKPIDESVQKVFEVTQRPLQPGSEYRFQVGFENLPRNWNYRVPVIDLIKLAY
jgi:hypothetical protein